MRVPFGLVVRIPGFHPGGPGSIPGMGSFIFTSIQKESENFNRYNSRSIKSTITSWSNAR